MTSLSQGLGVYLQDSPPLAVLVAFAGGVLASLTPCVYPVIPIIVGYVGSSREKSRLRAFLLSLFYVIGMAITFAGLGAFAALSGRLFGQVQSSPVAHIIVGNIIILFGLSLLGVFTLPLPSFLAKRKASGRRGLLGAASMGLASGFVTAPCTAAVLGVLLTYVATRQNVIFGMITLFSFAMGMGVLLILIGTSAGLLAALPKSGRWMERVEKVMGWGMLILGEYFLIRGGYLLV
ncbi:MAG: protein-disulfide reductase DsbD family protein [Planctomycetota bacterium]|jgi:thiol:disulfide interchange protein DsbD